MLKFGAVSQNVLLFLVFSAAAVFVYYAVPRKCRPVLLLALNAGFYFLCDWKSLPVLYGTTALTWWIGKHISLRHSKKLLILGCSFSAILLFFFKYTNYLSAQLGQVFDSVGMSAAEPVFSILIPMGISYYVFKQISYLSDIYRGKIQAEKSFIVYANYVTLFTEILSGPISRFREYKDGVDTGMVYSAEKMQHGFYLICRGLFMKLVIANQLSGYTGAVFTDPGKYPSLALWMGAFFYAVRLYCDFAGYSSLAIGVTECFGLHRKENFRRPYLSTSIQDFWRRWHISLSQWLRDYIYIPLGGGRCSSGRHAVNVLIVFLVSGIWHGAGMTFLLWGLYHGLLSLIQIRTHQCRGAARVIRTLITFALVTFGWILFGAGSVQIAGEYIIHLFFGFSLSMAAIQASLLPFTGDNKSVAVFAVLMIQILLLLIYELRDEKKQFCGTEKELVFWQVFWLSSTILLGNYGSSAFIYANF